jgi:hypothetical protein
MDTSNRRELVRFLVWGCTGTAAALLFLLVLLVAIKSAPMLLSLPFAAVTLWPYCLGAALFIGGAIVLLRFLDRKYGKIAIALAFATASLLALLAGTGLTLSGIGGMLNSSKAIRWLVPGLVVGILGLGSGLVAGIVYLAIRSGATSSSSLDAPEKVTAPGQSATPTNASVGSPAQAPVSSTHRPPLKATLGITCLLSAVLGALFIIVVILMIVGLALLVWLFRDLDLNPVFL